MLHNLNIENNFNFNFFNILKNTLFFMCICLVFVILKPSEVFLLNEHNIDIDYIEWGKYIVEFKGHKILVLDSTGTKKMNWILSNIQYYFKYHKLLVETVIQVTDDVYCFIGTKQQPSQAYPSGLFCIMYHGHNIAKESSLNFFDVMFYYDSKNPVLCDSGDSDNKTEFPNTWCIYSRQEFPLRNTIYKMQNDPSITSEKMKNFIEEMVEAIDHHSYGLDYLLNRIFFTNHEISNPITWKHIQLVLDKGAFIKKHQVYVDDYANYQRNHLWRTLQYNYTWYISYSDMYQSMSKITNWAKLHKSDQDFLGSDQEYQKIIINRFKTIMNDYFNFCSKLK